MQLVTHWGGFSGERGVTPPAEATPRSLGLCLHLSLGTAVAAAGFASECSKAGQAAVAGL